VVSRFVVVNLMDRDGGMNDVRLDDLSIDNGLDRLVNVLQENG
jgi:hypothetical protein